MAIAILADVSLLLLCVVTDHLSLLLRPLVIPIHLSDCGQISRQTEVLCVPDKSILRVLNGRSADDFCVVNNDLHFANVDFPLF